jgi:hypothetical protein
VSWAEASTCFEPGHLGSQTLQRLHFLEGQSQSGTANQAQVPFWFGAMIKPSAWAWSGMSSYVFVFQPRPFTIFADDALVCFSICFSPKKEATVSCACHDFGELLLRLLNSSANASRYFCETRRQVGKWHLWPSHAPLLTSYCSTMFYSLSLPLYVSMLFLYLQCNFPAAICVCLSVSSLACAQVCLRQRQTMHDRFKWGSSCFRATLPQH